MELNALLELNSSFLPHEAPSEARIQAVLEPLRKQIAFYREYPDLLIDLMVGEDGGPYHFHFFFYQRIFIRIVMRHKYVYATFPRAYSKSFLSMMVLMLRCVLFPHSELFVTTGGKEQAASITIAKIEEICRLIPALHNELRWEKGKDGSKTGKDNVKYRFKNGSTIDILAARESSRGQRRTGGLMEECVLIDQTALNEIIIPTTNVDRPLPDGTRDPDEVVNKSQIYITTAGWKNSFAYEKLIELLIRSLIEPDNVMILGGTWRTPVKEGLLSANFVEDLKIQGTYAEDSFNREYGSEWSGDAENAFFSAEAFDKNRVLLLSENAPSKKSKSAYYVIGVDVGRYDCTTEAMVFKVIPQPQGTSIKSLVNIYTFEEEHFEQQAINLKRLFFQYSARTMAIDANGIGAGLVDFLTISQIDPETGEELPPLGVENDDKGRYKKLRTASTISDALYLIKANSELNTEAYAYTKTQMAGSKIRFLVEEGQAKTKLLSTKVGQGMSTSQRNEYLRPYVLTTILREQLLNLVENKEGTNIVLERSSKGVKKDKVSALIYGLYYIKQDDDKRLRRKNKNISDYMFFTP